MTHRVIDSLEFTLDADQALVVPLDRRGLPEAGCPNGGPRHTRRPTIDAPRTTQVGATMECSMPRWTKPLASATFDQLAVAFGTSRHHVSN